MISNSELDDLEMYKINGSGEKGSPFKTPHYFVSADALIAWRDREVEEAELKGEIKGHYAAAACLGELDTVSRDGSYWFEHKEAADYIVGYAKEIEEELADLRATHSSRKEPDAKTE